MKGVVQVGAHYGEEYEGWLAEGAQHFIFFEPVSFNFTKLKNIFSFREGDFVFHNLALGNMTGQVKMYLETSHSGKSCSILKPALHFKQYPDIRFDEEEMVLVDKLDNIEYDRTLYDHLCIDVEGYELEVLKGAEESLRYFETIETEVHRAEVFEKCAMYVDVCNFLFEQGFSLMSVFWRGNTWGDAKFKRLPEIKL